MKIIKGSLLAASVVLMFISFSAGSVRAQWIYVDSNTDNVGHLTYYEEKNPRGDVRRTTNAYFVGTHVVSDQTIKTTRADGSSATIVEQHDRLKRTTSISNEYKDNRGRLIRGVRQSWTYRNDRDRRGIQKDEKYDPNTRRWVRL